MNNNKIMIMIIITTTVLIATSHFYFSTPPLSVYVIFSSYRHSIPKSVSVFLFSGSNTFLVEVC